MHATLFAKAMEAIGLESSYGAYLDQIPGATLATVNLISALGLNRSMRGALVGHLAMFEISSPVPNGRYAKGLRRLGFGEDALDFFESTSRLTRFTRTSPPTISPRASRSSSRS